MKLYSSGIFLRYHDNLTRNCIYINKSRPLDFYAPNFRHESSSAKLYFIGCISRQGWFDRKLNDSFLFKCSSFTWYPLEIGLWYPYYFFASECHFLVTLLRPRLLWGVRNSTLEWLPLKMKIDDYALLETHHHSAHWSIAGSAFRYDKCYSLYFK